MTTLAAHDIDKRFGAVHAVDRASLTIEPGRIHAVVGENGAGKSTLLKMMAGLVVPDAGTVTVDGARLVPHAPAEAIRRGVGIVQQHFALIDVFTALENVALGLEPVKALGRLDLAKARARVGEVLRELGGELPLDVPVSTLGVGDRQRLEITRALVRDARVLILDEPTAVLTPLEAGALYVTLRRLADAGRAVVVVTHKLDEVRDHADVVTVVRKGRVVTTRAMTRGEGEVRALAEAIMGSAPCAAARRAVPATAGAREPVITLKDVRLGRALRGLTLSIAAGEVVGVAGVEGNGQREMVRVLAGLDAPEGGEVHPLPAALAVVHEDRQLEGLVLDAPVRDNAVLGELARFSRRGLLDLGAIDAEARARVKRSGAPPDVDRPVRELSGGNQQKIVIARAIARVEERGARGLVLAHPTRGVDVGAAEAIHTEILAAAARGAAVLVVSHDLSELRALADRICVMARGRVAAELPPTATDAEIGAAMLGTAPATTGAIASAEEGGAHER